MKVLFLDHDGVICLSSNFGTRFKKGKGHLKDDSVLNRFDNFDKKAINVLNNIVEKTGCEIVVSSDWKQWATVEEMGEYYEHHGIIKKPFDFTTSINDVDVPKDFKWDHNYDLEQTRCLEIKDWLEKHPEVTHWVAIDDMHLGTTVEKSGLSTGWGLSNFVWCPVVYEGIKQTGVKDKVISFFE